MLKIISKLVFYTLVLSGVLGIFSLGVSKLNLVLAQNIDDSGITYPIEDLGNCASKSECKTYCDIKENQGTCLDFAGQNGLMKKTEVDQAKKILQLSEQGTDTPGACKGQEECNAYCSDSAHLDECVIFGEKVGLISPEEVKMIKKTGGKGPGSCQGKKACDAYCENETNLDECISFAEQNGLMTAQEKEIIKKTGGKGPGGCKGKEGCDAFCGDEKNFDACIEFGHQYGMMNDEEYAMAKKMGPKMMSQGGPGGCKGKEECDVFCGDEKNFDTCLEFGKQNGMMNEEEYAMAKKMGPKMMSQGGPGGCRGKQECEAFCSNPANGEECMKFAVSSGMMSEEEAAKMKERGFMAPPKDALGAKGEFMGPGGCKTQEECAAFCSEEGNEKVCSMFGAGRPSGQGGDNPTMPGTETDGQGNLPPGPGGCDSPIACMKFCSESANQDTCMKFAPPSPREDQTPGDFQVPRRKPDQNQSGKNSLLDDKGGEPGQNQLGQKEPLDDRDQPGQWPRPQNVPGEQGERTEPGQPEFTVPPPGSQPVGEFNPPMVENKLNSEFILQEGQPMQSPTNGGEQPPTGIQPAGQIEQVPFVRQAPPPSEPAPQALSAPRLLISALNFFASAMASFFSR